MMIVLDNKQQTQVSVALIIFLSLLVLFTLFYGLWQWREDWSLTHSPALLPAPLATSNEVEGLIASLSTAHLFGQSLSSDVPVTSLQFRVTGIVKVSVNSGAISKAYISIGGQPGKIYQVGDELPYGVRIYDITADAVILENDGRLEKLPLPREPLQFKAPTKQEAY